MTSTATAANLRRKAAFVDRVQLHNGAPLFSWIDLNLTELCNRKCVFCPRADESFYPNQALHMPVPLAQKIGDELRAIEYRGAVVLCGFGEPLLHPRILEIVRALRGVRIEIVTNGDRLTAPLIRSLVDAGVSFFVVSLYDGPHQTGTMHARFAEAGVGACYLLRDRWHGADQDFGVKLTNRAGTVSVGHQPGIEARRPCHYLAYQLTVDWNGDVLLCVQDWHKKVKYGNLALQPLLDVWTSKAMHKRRMQLIEGRRTEAPCRGCNTNGTLHGAAHVSQWLGEREAA